jgi:murein DD-endopeptidase MepM/ murein hydrolase activator NlpD
MFHSRVSCGKNWIAIGILAVGSCVLSSAKPLSATPDNGGIVAPSLELSGVKVTTSREGELTHFYVENQEYCEVTMTFEMGLQNLKGDTNFPYTVSIPARQTSEAFILSPVVEGAAWEYSYTNFYKLGSNVAQHDDSYLYQLPYQPGTTYRVTQASNGSFSHKGSNKNAIDWKMPEGTPVHAARGGIVVKTKEDSNRGGASMAYDKYNNYVLIRHDDGTLGHYCHLRKNGVRVHSGQIVHTGDLIAYSGNSGFSSGPHLHFCVFRTLNGKERESIPIRFQTGDGGLALESGRKYKATELPPIPVAQRARELAHQGGAS